MASIGPQLPKRKRSPTDDEDKGGRSSPPAKHPRDEPPSRNQHEIDLDDSDSDDGYGPSAPSGPVLPPANRDAIDLESDSDSDTGPAPPPPPPSTDALHRTAPSRPEPNPESSSDDDDDYGPSLPSASTASRPTIGPSLPPPPEAAPQRDEWMLAPPTASSFTERDPTRIRSRKFASKPGPSGPSPGVSSIWTETPEEKLQRLQDAVLGRGDRTQETGAAASAAGLGMGRKTAEEEERDRRIAARVEAQRGGSLYDEHQKRKGGKGEGEKEEEDDPSKRGFDREKDMALGGRIGTAQRRELMSKSANFGGRFQKGSYL